MNTLLIIAVSAILLAVATRVYGGWIGRVFGLNDDTPPPSVTNADGRDFVASPTQVVFAHHFASIAGAGPIVGPIIALAWGWGPAWIWIIVGGIFFGAMHDMAALCVSMREGGRSIAEIARRTLGRGGFLLFVVFLILVLSLINAIFLNFSAMSLTSLVPIADLGVPAEDTVLRTVERGGVTMAVVGGIATTSVFFMTAFAPLLGWGVARKGLRGPGALAAAAGICAIAIVAGFLFPVQLSEDPERAQQLWRWMLAGYVFLGGWIPVWLVLQPRDFCNVQILYVGLGCLLVGTLVGGFQGASLDAGRALQLETGAESQGPIWPILMITIACGAISGFHALVASGTSVKQLRRESDCRRVGYGAMALESLLATVVLVTVAHQLTPGEYGAMMLGTEGAKANPILTFAVAAGRTIEGLGVPADVGTVIGILIVEGFLVTTLDTSVRLGRYLLEELWTGLFGERTPVALRHPIVNTLIAVGLMLVIAFSSFYGQIWTIFGAGNQLIAALTLTTVSVYLIARGRRWLFAAVPAAIMTVTTLAALALIVRREFQAFADDGDAANPMLGGLAATLLALAIAFVAIALVRVRGALRTARAEADSPPRS